MLWDHFHDLSLMRSHIFLADASLFVVLTGITTAFQLREPLRQHGKSIDNDMSLYSPRPAFDWRYFLATRLIGIMPIMWLSLLVYAPIWYLENNVPKPRPPPSNEVVSDTLLCYY